jgi:hypothetical protein
MQQVTLIDAYTSTTTQFITYISSSATGKPTLSPANINLLTITDILSNSPAQSFNSSPQATLYSRPVLLPLPIPTTSN